MKHFITSSSAMEIDKLNFGNSISAGIEQRFVTHGYEYIGGGPMREPDRCKSCGRPLEMYGAVNGIIGWHMHFNAMNSMYSDLCTKCCDDYQRNLCTKK